MKIPHGWSMLGTETRGLSHLKATLSNIVISGG